MSAIAARSAASLGLVAIVTVLCSRLLSVNATTAGFAYLIVVLAIATGWGLVEAVTASVTAMLCFNFFFFPPVGRLTIADPQNWVALGTFLVTALVASHLSNRAKRQAMEAKERQRETEQLYAFSRAILLTESSHVHPAGFQAAQHIAQTFDCPAVALYDAKAGQIYRGGTGDLPDIETKLKRVVVEGSRLAERSADIMVTPITLGGRPIGSLALKGISCSDGALQALVNLVAIALERARSAEAASRAEAARQSEEFKSTLLDAIAHEFKTPLTSIKAASTSILSDSASLSSASREMAQIIDEEADRLTLLVTEAVRMSQIEAGKVRVERRLVKLRELLRDVLAHFESRTEGRPIPVEIPSAIPEVPMDPDLIGLALRQLVDNALKYSPTGAPILIKGMRKDEALEIRVIDHGPGIPERERERIFDRYYRRHVLPGQVPGSGLGLYIAREIVRAHGGDLWVEGQMGSGSEFCISLPLEAARS
ncbi:MAG: ATP-binding protein [Bryobacteraceae bacterium]